MKVAILQVSEKLFQHIHATAQVQTPYRLFF